MRALGITAGILAAVGLATLIAAFAAWVHQEHEDGLW